jgi:glutamate synthase (NADPH/NADH) small chain
MPNMSLKKVEMPEQDPNIRNKNFSEVALGYTEEMAIEEAERCLQCKHRPCVAGCPVNVQIPEFIKYIAEGKFEQAYKKIIETNNLPAICGRVCPQETQCEQLCVRSKKGEAVGIGRLERFAADWYMKNKETEKPNIEKNGKKVAVIGAGPAGLTCAADLAKAGYEVTIFEAFHTPGGVLMYGIPEFRLPKELVQKEIDSVKKLGVDIKTNMVIGKILSLDELKEEGYQAIFIGTGAGLPSFMNIPGENLNGVYSANEFLTRVNLMKAYKFPEYDTPIRSGKNVAVVGGGNVAMDAARSAKRLGAENVYIIYRRSEAEMPARLEEVHHAKEEGIIFKLLTNPTRIIGNKEGYVEGIECIEMELGEPDSSGRRRPIPIQGSEKVIDVDTVIIAIGQSPNPLIKSTTPDLETHKWGGIIADEETGATSKEGVYAGGDAVTGAATAKPFGSKKFLAYPSFTLTISSFLPKPLTSCIKITFIIIPPFQLSFSLSLTYSIITYLSCSFASSIEIPSICAPATVKCPPPPSFSIIT